MTYEQALKVLEKRIMYAVSTCASFSGGSFDDWEQRRIAENVVALHRSCKTCAFRRYEIRPGVLGIPVPTSMCVHPKLLNTGPAAAVSGDSKDTWEDCVSQRMLDGYLCGRIGKLWEPKA